jgi:hypothetical protein
MGLTIGDQLEPAGDRSQDLRGSAAGAVALDLAEPGVGSLRASGVLREQRA